ncbi:MAG: hypothetical protein U5P41_08830 [Gammaproteobacteria bacterium]|nr:hypothetical protein [Gammaproteobacteria bacterium]
MKTSVVLLTLLLAGPASVAAHDSKLDRPRQRTVGHGAGNDTRRQARPQTEPVRVP